MTTVKPIPEFVYTNEGELYYPCYYCDRAFKYKKSHTSHIEKCHSGVKLFRPVQETPIYIDVSSEPYTKPTPTTNNGFQEAYSAETSSTQQQKPIKTPENSSKTEKSQNTNAKSKNLKSVIENIVDKKLKQAGLMLQPSEAEPEEPEPGGQHNMGLEEEEKSLNLDEFFFSTTTTEDYEYEEYSSSELIDIDETFLENNPDLIELQEINPHNTANKSIMNMSLKDLHNSLKSLPQDKDKTTVIYLDSPSTKNQIKSTTTQQQRQKHQNQQQKNKSRVLRSDIKSPNLKHEDEEQLIPQGTIPKLSIGPNGKAIISYINNKDVNINQEMKNKASTSSSTTTTAAAATSSIAERIQKFNQSQRAINYLKNNSAASSAANTGGGFNSILNRHSLVNPRISIGSNGKPTITYDIEATEKEKESELKKLQSIVKQLPSTSEILQKQNKEQNTQKPSSQQAKTKNNGFEVIINEKNIIKLYGQPKLTIGPTGVPIITLAADKNKILKSQEEEELTTSDDQELIDDFILIDDDDDDEEKEEEEELVGVDCIRNVVEEDVVNDDEEEGGEDEDVEGEEDEEEEEEVPTIAQTLPRAKKILRTKKQRTNYLNKLRRTRGKEERIEHEVSTIGSNLLKLTIKKSFSHHQKSSSKSKSKNRGEKTNKTKHAFRVVPRSRNPLLMKFKKIPKSLLSSKKQKTKNKNSNAHSSSEDDDQESSESDTTTTTRTKKDDVYDFNEPDSTTNVEKSQKRKNQTNKLDQITEKKNPKLTLKFNKKQWEQLQHQHEQQEKEEESEEEEEQQDDDEHQEEEIEENGGGFNAVETGVSTSSFSTFKSELKKIDDTQQTQQKIQINDNKQNNKQKKSPPQLLPVSDVLNKKVGSTGFAQNATSAILGASSSFSSVKVLRTKIVKPCLLTKPEAFEKTELNSTQISNNLNTKKIELNDEKEKPEVETTKTDLNSISKRSVRSNASLLKDNKEVKEKSPNKVHAQNSNNTVDVDIKLNNKKTLPLLSPVNSSSRICLRSQKIAENNAENSSSSSAIISNKNAAKTELLHSHSNSHSENERENFEKTLEALKLRRITTNSSEGKASPSKHHQNTQEILKIIDEEITKKVILEAKEEEEEKKACQKEVDCLIIEIPECEEKVPNFQSNNNNKKTQKSVHQPLTPNSTSKKSPNPNKKIPDLYAIFPQNTQNSRQTQDNDKNKNKTKLNINNNLTSNKKTVAVVAQQSQESQRNLRSHSKIHDEQKTDEKKGESPEQLNTKEHENHQQQENYQPRSRRSLRREKINTTINPATDNKNGANNHNLKITVSPGEKKTANKGATTKNMVLENSFHIHLTNANSNLNQNKEEEDNEQNSHIQVKTVDDDLITNLEKSEVKTDTSLKTVGEKSEVKTDTSLKTVGNKKNPVDKPQQLKEEEENDVILVNDNVCVDLSAENVDDDNVIIITNAKENQEKVCFLNGQEEDKKSEVKTTIATPSTKKFLTTVGNKKIPNEDQSKIGNSDRIELNVNTNTNNKQKITPKQIAKKLTNSLIKETSNEINHLNIEVEEKEVLQPKKRCKLDVYSFDDEEDEIVDIKIKTNKSSPFGKDKNSQTQTQITNLSKSKNKNNKSKQGEEVRLDLTPKKTAPVETPRRSLKRTIDQITNVGEDDEEIYSNSISKLNEINVLVKEQQQNCVASSACLLSKTKRSGGKLNTNNVDLNAISLSPELKGTNVSSSSIRVTRSSSNRFKKSIADVEPQDAVVSDSEEPIKIVVTADVHYCPSEEPKIVPSPVEELTKKSVESTTKSQKLTATTKRALPQDLDAITVEPTSELKEEVKKKYPNPKKQQATRSLAKTVTKATEANLEQRRNKNQRQKRLPNVNSTTPILTQPNTHNSHKNFAQFPQINNKNKKSPNKILNVPEQEDNAEWNVSEVRHDIALGRKSQKPQPRNLTRKEKKKNLAQMAKNVAAVKNENENEQFKTSTKTQNSTKKTKVSLLKQKALPANNNNKNKIKKGQQINLAKKTRNGGSLLSSSITTTTMTTIKSDQRCLRSASTKINNNKNLNQKLKNQTKPKSRVKRKLNNQDQGQSKINENDEEKEQKLIDLEKEQLEIEAEKEENQLKVEEVAVKTENEDIQIKKEEEITSKENTDSEISVIESEPKIQCKKTKKCKKVTLKTKFANFFKKRDVKTKTEGENKKQINVNNKNSKRTKKKSSTKAPVKKSQKSSKTAKNQKGAPRQNSSAKDIKVTTLKTEVPDDILAEDKNQPLVLKQELIIENADSNERSFVNASESLKRKRKRKESLTTPEKLPRFDPETNVEVKIDFSDEDSEDEYLPKHQQTNLTGIKRLLNHKFPAPDDSKRTKRPPKGLKNNSSAQNNKKATKFDLLNSKENKVRQPRKRIKEEVKQEVVSMDDLDLPVIPEPVDSVVINNEHVCIKCGKICKDFLEFEQHKKTHKKIRMSEDELVKIDELYAKMKIKLCPICKLPTPRKDSWQRHRKFHTTTLSFYCTICNKGFTRKDLRNAHQKRHEVMGASSSTSPPQTPTKSNHQKTQQKEENNDSTTQISFENNNKSPQQQEQEEETNNPQPGQEDLNSQSTL